TEINLLDARENKSASRFGTAGRLIAPLGVGEGTRRSKADITNSDPDQARPGHRREPRPSGRNYCSNAQGRVRPDRANRRSSGHWRAKEWPSGDAPSASTGKKPIRMLRRRKDSLSR